MKKVLVGAVAALAMLLGATTARTAPYADVVAVVDESGSMSTEHAWIGPMIASANGLDAELIAAGLQPNRYGLVGFGNSAIAPRQINVGGGQFGTAAQFNTATGSLVINGSTEDGWRGIMFALTNYSYRSDAAKNLILVTDEDRDNTVSLQYSEVLNALKNNNALLNAVVNASFQDGMGREALGIDADGNAYIADGMGGFFTSLGGHAVSGAGNTLADYVDLALASGGAAWDLNQLRAGGLTADSFTAAFTSIKVGEIIEQQGEVPEPGTLALLVTGLIGGATYGWRRKRLV